MILTPHAIVGATLANIVPNEPILGFGLAFLSHYILDMIPHKDYSVANFLDKDTKTVKSILKSTAAALHFLFVVIDFIIAVILCFLIFVRDEKSVVITLIGIFGGLLPDLLIFLYYKFKRQPFIFFHKVHGKTHHDIEMKDNPLLGYSIQFVLVVLFLLLYYWFKGGLI